MRLWKRRISHDARRPEGVRINRRDGTTVPCGILRDPAGDKRGLACWKAFPLDADYRLANGDSLECDLLPAHSALEMAVPLPSPGAAS